MPRPMVVRSRYLGGRTMDRRNIYIIIGAVIVLVVAGAPTGVPIDLHAFEDDHRTGKRSHPGNLGSEYGG